MSSLKKLVAVVIASTAMIIALFAVAAPASAAPTPAAAGMQVTAANTGEGLISEHHERTQGTVRRARQSPWST